MRIALLGVASSLHSEEYYVPLYSKLIEGLTSTFNLKIYEKPFTDRVEVEDYRVYDAFIIVFLTGGTSRVVYEFISKKLKPVVLIASGEHNALASALSVKSRLMHEGLKHLLLTYSGVDDFKHKVNLITRALDIAGKLENLRILEINEEGVLSEDALNYVKSIGGVVEPMSFFEIIDRAENVEYDEALYIVDKLREIYGFEGYNEQILLNARLIKALMNLADERKYDVISIDCFPFIVKTGVTPCITVSFLNTIGIPTMCEDDFYSIPLMYIAKSLTGFSGWIANPSGFKDKYLRFAHCTIAGDIGCNCRLINHFETGRPYGVTCSFKEGNVLFGRFTRDYSRLVMYRGVIVESGLLGSEYCRTQVLVETPGLTPDKFYMDAVGNHHVFIVDKPGVRESLEFIAWWKGWRITWMN